MKANDVIRPYFQNMPSIMVAADLVICRAGALTISEIIELEKPSIFIPLSLGGQEANAEMLKDKNAALVYENANVEEALLKAIEIVNNPEKLQKMKINLKSFKEGNAVQHIIENLDIWGNNK